MGRPDRIPVKCPNCGTGLRAPLHFAGKRAKCRVCGNKVPVPAIVESVVTDPVIEAEALDDDATEMMSVEDLEPEYEAKPPPKRPPRSEPEPEEDEDDEKPRPRPRRQVNDEDEDDDRPMRRSARREPDGAGSPIVWYAAGAVFFVIALACGTFVLLSLL